MDKTTASFSLLELLKSRLELAKSFSRDFKDIVEKSVEDYYCNDTEQERLAQLGNINARYEFKIPYIFATQESMVAKILSREYELLFTGRGKLDEAKEEIIRATYSYLSQVCNLPDVKYRSLWWFILSGFVVASAEFKQEYTETPLMNEDGTPQVDEMGQPLMGMSFSKDNPEVTIEDPRKVYFSPESKFTQNADQIPFLIKEGLLELSEIEKLYDVEVEADYELTSQDKDKIVNDDIKRCKTFFYYGEISETDDIKKHIEEFNPESKYYIVFTNKEVLHTEEIVGSRCRLGKWYGNPSDFFGFGIGKTLRNFQRELSLRRGQQVRYADIAAYPKLGVEESSDVDAKALLDPRENVVLLFKDKLPQYLTVPDMSNTMIMAEQKAREDAQFVSGILDLSKGAQQSTVVKTATGQTMFAEMSEVRLEQAKRLFGNFYKSLVVLLFELCRDNWAEDKIVQIMDKDGNTQDITLNGESLKGIDFDKDIDIQMESPSMNKDVMRAQAIEFYNSVQGNQLVNQQEALKFVLKYGFGQKNPERFILDQETVDANAAKVQMAGETKGFENMPGSETGQVKLPNVG